MKAPHRQGRRFKPSKTVDVYQNGKLIDIYMKQFNVSPTFARLMIKHNCVDANQYRIFRNNRKKKRHGRN